MDKVVMAFQACSLRILYKMSILAHDPGHLLQMSGRIYLGEIFLVFKGLLFMAKETKLLVAIFIDSSGRFIFRMI